MKSRILREMTAAFFLILISCSYPEYGRPGSGSRVYYGKASYYGKQFHGRKTASGETFNMHALTAAHRNFPFGTVCKVVNASNGKSVIVTINDRGPFVQGRILDLSYGAAERIGGLREGVMTVRIEVLKWGG
jgi:rare lipoprotein A